MSEIFNISTIMLSQFAGSAAIGVFVFWAWLRERDNVALRLWAVAFGAASAGAFIMALRGHAPDWLSLGIGNLLLLASVSLLWLGFRAFEGLPVSLLFGAVGPLCWALGYFLIPAFAEDINARIIVASAVLATYSVLLALSAREGHRREPLPVKPLVAFVFTAHAAIHVLRIPLALALPVAVVGASPVSDWFGVIAFELLLHSLFAGFSIFVLIRERVEFRYKVASEIDELTGVLNRRAFLGYVASIRRRNSGRDGVLALLDIDHFKRVNDTYGHSAGDEALRAFSRVVGDLLPAGCIFGRLGGEEFAVYMPNSDMDAARLRCEEIRQAVEQATVDIGGHELRMTVSQGLGLDVAAETDLTFLLGIADRALYISKRKGRNLVTTLNASAGLKMVAAIMAAADRADSSDGRTGRVWR